MRRLIFRTIELVVYAAVAAALIGMFCAYTVGRTGWARQFVHRAAVQQVANLLGRPVRVGPVGGDMWRGLWIDGVSIDGPDGRPELLAERVEVEWDLAALVRRVRPPQQCIRRIRLIRPYVQLVRDEAGKVNLVRLLESLSRKFARPRKPGPPPPVSFVVELRDGIVDYNIGGPGLPGGKPQRGRLMGVDATIDPRSAGLWRARISFQADGTYLRRVDASIGVRPETGEVGVQAVAEGVVLPAAARLASSMDGVQVLTGSADVFIFAWLPGRGKQARVSGGATIRGLTMRLRQVPHLIRADAVQLTFADSLVYAFSPALRIGNSEAQVRAAVWDFGDPSLAMALQGQVDVEQVLAQVPEEAAKKLPELRDVGTAGVEAWLGGPAGHLQLEANIEIDHRVSAQVQEVDVGIESARIAVRAYGLADRQPAAALRVDGRGVEARGLPAVKLPDGTEARPEVPRIAELHVDATMASGVACAATELKVPSIAGLPLAVRDVKGKVSLAGDVVCVRDISAAVEGGRAQGQAVAQLTRSPQIEAQLDVQGIELASLKPLTPRDFEHSVSGLADADIYVSYAEGQAAAAGTVAVAEPGFDDYSAVSLRAAFVTVGQRVDVPWAVVNAPEGRVVAAGAVEESNVTAHFSAADVDLAKLARRFDAEDVHGRAWLTGFVSGELEDIRLDADVAVLGGGFRNHELQAAYVHVTGGIASLRIPTLLAYRDGAVLRFTGRLSELAGEEPYGSVTGTFALVGLTLPQVTRWFELEERYRLAGQAEVRGTIDGPLVSPSVRGTVHLAGLQYDIYRLDELLGPVKYHEDRLTIGPAHGRLQGAKITVSATAAGVRDKGGQARVQVRLSSGPAKLSALVPLYRYGVALAGEAEVTNASVEIEGGKLVGATAEVLCRGVELGDGALAPFRLVVRARDEVVELAQVSLPMADGRLRLAGRYDTAKRLVSAQVHAQDCSLPRLLRIARQAAPAMAGEEGDAEALARQLESAAMRLRGTLTGSVELAGSIDEPVVRAELQARGMALDGRELPKTRVCAEYVASHKRLQNIVMEAWYGQGLVIVEGDASIGDKVRLTVDASELDVRRLASWLPFPLSADGSLQFTCVVTGRTEQPVIKGSFDITDAIVEGFRFDLVSAPIVQVAEGGIDVDTLILKRGNHEIVAHGHIPFSWTEMQVPTDEPIDFKAAFANADLDLIRTFAEEYYRAHQAGGSAGPLEALEATGRLDASIEAAGTLANPALRGSLQVRNGAIRMKSWNRPIKDINVRLAMTPSPQGTVVRLEELAADYHETQLWGRGSVVLTQAAKDRLLDNYWDLSFGVKGRRVSFAGGTAAIDPDVEVSVKSLKPGAVEVAVKRGQAAFGLGTATLKGRAVFSTAQFSELHRNYYDLSLELDRAAIRYGDTIAGLLSGRVGVKSGEGQGAQVQGQLWVTHAVLSYSGKGGRRPEMTAAPDSFPRFKFDVRCGIGEDVAVKGAGINMPLQRDAGAIVVTGTPQSPHVRGRLAAVAGRVSMPGGLVDVQEFSVVFAVEPRAGAVRAPRPLDLRAEVRGRAERVVSQVRVDDQLVGPVHIYLNFSGGIPGQIRVTATSEPPLAEEQIYAILGAEPFGGLTAAGQIGGQALSQRFVSLLAMGLRAGVLEPLEAQLRQLLGLAEFSINFRLDQPVEVRVGKYIVRNLLVSYRRSVGSGEDEWWLSVSYEVLPGTVVSYYTRYDGEERFSVGMRRTF